MYSTDGGELLYHIRCHIIRLAIFFTMMICFSFFSIRFWHSIGYLFYAIVLFLLIGASLHGVAASGSQRWVSLYFLNLQPSELMKIITRLTTAIIPIIVYWLLFVFFVGSRQCLYFLPLPQ